MGDYGSFAYVYDSLMSDVDYKERSEYILSLFEKFDKKPSLILDAACGTGSFSNEFSRLGCEVIGVDMSEDMLSVAREKSAKEGNDILFLCQELQQLDLYGTVDGAVCCLDSLNHITDYADFKRSLERIALFLEENRLFIFDVNTVYKHREILADNTFVLEQDGVFCVWQNEFSDADLTTDIYLDFFVKNEKGNYERTSSEFSERAYTEAQISDALKDANLEIVAVYKDLKLEEPDEETDRVIYITRKKSENQWQNL